MLTLIKRCRLAGALLLALMLGAALLAKTQERSPHILNENPGNLAGAPFQAEQTWTRIDPDGTEHQDLSIMKIARNSDGCLRIDQLEDWPHQPSPHEVERFNAASMGSPEEQSLRINYSMGSASITWRNSEPRSALRPLGIRSKCVVPGRINIPYCTAFQLAPGLKLPSGYTEKDLGTKTIEGVAAHGLLITGEKSSEESWCSDELGVMMIVIRHDRESNRTTRFELKHVTRTEPDPQLFELPEEHEEAMTLVVGAPFQGEWIHTLIDPDGTEHPDPGLRGDQKVARSRDGCLRTDELTIPWNSLDLPSQQEVQGFRAATMGSPEEQALNVEIALNDGVRRYWWVNTEAVPQTPDPKWECRAQRPIGYLYCGLQSPIYKQSPPGERAEDLGTKIIDGVAAHGLRVTTTTIKSETWCSNEIGSMMLLINQMKRADGWHTSKWELKHVTRTEPDPAFFKFPAVDKAGHPIQGPPVGGIANPNVADH